MKTKAKPTGRPTKYKDEYSAQALKLCKLGATDKELASFFEVHVDTIDEWKRVYPAFSVSLKEGKLAADAEVASKLFHRATGYSHKAVKIVADAKTKDEHVVEYDEHYPPDTTAAIFWLKNRRPDLWRDKIDHGVGGINGGAVETVTRIEIVPMRNDK
ncbi:helix-turn-helix domain-containing protein [uncultured Rhodoferax sp.]|uniref:helix-turn-helix domain-containing protein n=1 Tax=uncultured Rhodoferax sp. TaxID=223188 RepID=UPI0025D5A968|nr:helix-turn-helix domain-containing protein [uncultured Rhodoferax sp.]